MARATGESALAKLAVSVGRLSPRVLVLSAPAGYRKGSFLRRYAASAAQLVVCDLTTPGAASDLSRSVLDAVVARDRRRAARSAADRLAQPREIAALTSREALRREWPALRDAELFVLRDPAGALATAAGVDLLAELIATMPPACTLALQTRSPLPAALRALIPPGRSVTIAAAELALSTSEVAELARAAGVAGDALDELSRAVQGWPLVLRLLADLLRGEGADDVNEAVRTLAAPELLAFAMHRTIAKLDEAHRSALAISVIRRGATHRDLVRAMGAGCDDLAFARLCALPFVVLDGDRVVVHPEAAVLLRARFEPLVRTLFERTLDVLTGDGAYAEAAQIALDNGDVERAAAIVDAVPPYTSAPFSLGEYERIIDQIDRSLVTRYPNLWIATIPYRAFAVDLATFVHEAETVYYCLGSATHPEQRAAALMLLANAYTNVGRTAESGQLLEEALHGFARDSPAACASVLNFAASLRGMEGRFQLARQLAREAATLSRQSFWQNQTLDYIEAHEAGYRGRWSRVAVILDEVVRRRAQEDLPLYLAYSATNAAFFAWVNGADQAFERYVGTIEEALTPGLERGLAPLIDAARGRPVQVDERYLWPALAGMAHLYRMEHARGADDALAAARAAALSADLRRDPYLQILAHSALFVLDVTSREREAALLELLVTDFESEEMRAAVAALLRGEPCGILEPFVRRRVLRERGGAEPRLAVELLTGQVTRDGSAVHVTDKEFELLAFLASVRGLVTRERIGETLWEHLDPEGWRNNLKVTLSRLRAKLGTRDAILGEEGCYRLSPVVDVDLRQAESVVREYRARQLDDDARAGLQAILSAYRGAGEARYERFAWAQSLTSRMREVVCVAGMILAEDAFAAGRFGDALARGGEVSAIDPLDEAACAAVIRAHRACGDPDAARRAFGRYAAQLAHELGAVPSARLAALARGGT